MFFGEYECRIDQEGRLVLPAGFRRDFKDRIVLARGLEKCIIGYTQEGWVELSETLASFPSNRSRWRRMGRFTFSTAFSLKLNSLGGFTLPIALRKYADIKDTVIIVGANKYLEFWSREHWNLEVSLMDKEAWQIFESIELR